MARKRTAAPKAETPAGPPEPDLSHIHPGLRHLAVPVSSLSPDQTNARVHDEKGVREIMASLGRFGQDVPLVVQRRGRVVRQGNGRLLAALRLGWSHVAALEVDEADAEAVARALADNRTADLSRFDPEALARAMALACPPGSEPAVPGWTAAEARALAAALSSAPKPEEAQGVLPGVPASAVGPPPLGPPAGGLSVPADPSAVYGGMPEYAHPGAAEPKARTLTVFFDDDAAVAELGRLVGRDLSARKYIWFPRKSERWRPPAHYAGEEGEADSDADGLAAEEAARLAAGEAAGEGGADVAPAQGLDPGGAGGEP